MAVMMAAAAFVMLLMAVMVAAAAFVMLLMAVMVAAAAFVVRFMIMSVFLLVGLAGGMCRIPGQYHHFPLHSPGDPDQFRDQRIRILRSETKLFGCKGDIRLLHLGVGIEFRLDFGGAVCAVQIVDDIYLSGHGAPSFIFIYEQTLMCLFQYTSIPCRCQEGVRKSYPVSPRKNRRAKARRFGLFT